jgi:hypothetical protein
VEKGMPVALLHFACVGEGNRILVINGSGKGFTNATMTFMMGICGMKPNDFMSKCTIVDLYTYARAPDADPSHKLKLLKDEKYIDLFISYLKAVLEYQEAPFELLFPFGKSAGQISTRLNKDQNYRLPWPNAIMHPCNFMKGMPYPRCLTKEQDQTNAVLNDTNFSALRGEQKEVDIASRKLAKSGDFTEDEREAMRQSNMTKGKFV